MIHLLLCLTVSLRMKTLNLKNMLCLLLNLYPNGVPNDPVFQIVDNTSLATFTQTDTTLSISVPAGVSDNIVIAYGDGAVNPDATYNLNVLRPSQVTDANAVLGFERFFNLSDFGFIDIEGLPLQSVLIQVVDGDLGSINIGQGQFSTDTTDIAQPIPIASTDFNNNNVVELTRDQIASGQVFFSSNPSPDNVGKTVDLEFNVKDSSGDISVIPGLIRISILDAPSTVEESIVDAKYKSIFEAELGTGRFDFTDRLIEQAGLTRDEGLTVIRSTAEDRTNSGLFASSTASPFNFSTRNSVEFRWDVGAFDIYSDSDPRFYFLPYPTLILYLNCIGHLPIWLSIPQIMHLIITILQLNLRQFSLPRI